MAGEAPKTTPLEKVEQRIEAVNLRSGEKLDPNQMAKAVDKAYETTKKNLEDQLTKAAKAAQELGDSEMVAHFRGLKEKKLQVLDAQRANCYQQLLEFQSREQEDQSVHAKETANKVQMASRLSDAEVRAMGLMPLSEGGGGGGAAPRSQEPKPLTPKERGELRKMGLMAPGEDGGDDAPLLPENRTNPLEGLMKPGE